MCHNQTNHLIINIQLNPSINIMSEIKECEIPEILIPTAYNKDNTELILTFPCTLLSEIKFKIVYFK